LAKQSCNLSTSNDDGGAAESLTSLFELLTHALYWTNFQQFDYDSYCRQTTKTSNPGASRCLFLLCPCSAS
jgi:hypothetical protein